MLGRAPRPVGRHRPRVEEVGGGRRHGHGEARVGGDHLRVSGSTAGRPLAAVWVAGDGRARESSHERGDVASRHLLGLVFGRVNFPNIMGKLGCLIGSSQ